MLLFSQVLAQRLSRKEGGKEEWREVNRSMNEKAHTFLHPSFGISFRTQCGLVRKDTRVIYTSRTWGDRGCFQDSVLGVTPKPMREEALGLGRGKEKTEKGREGRQDGVTRVIKATTI